MPPPLNRIPSTRSPGRAFGKLAGVGVSLFPPSLVPVSTIILCSCLDGTIPLSLGPTAPDDISLLGDQRLVHSLSTSIYHLAFIHAITTDQTTAYLKFLVFCCHWFGPPLSLSFSLPLHYFNAFHVCSISKSSFTVDVFNCSHAFFFFSLSPQITCCISMATQVLFTAHLIVHYTFFKQRR